ncbi:MAG: hypothetical protein KatS3mg110_2901 [Pirellulaceae bacterium]|nr:MAG: hypothetical protein KatS3mg110_2901 [Pirellulaceae bacterium]
MCGDVNPEKIPRAVSSVRQAPRQKLDSQDHAAASRTARQEATWALFVAGFSSVAVLLAMTVGAVYPGHGFPASAGQSRSGDNEPWPWVRSDAINYRNIVLRGYDRPGEHKISNAVFFPGYPFMVWVVSSGTFLQIEWSMLAVSLGCFLAGMALLPDYLVHYSWMDQRQRRLWILLFCLCPSSLFFRAGYSESMFLFAYVAFLLAVRSRPGRRWVHAGYWAAWASATRAVGLALPAVLGLHLLRNRAWRSYGVPAVLLCLGLSGLGLLAVCTYQQLVLGDALAFWHERAAWHLRPGNASWSEQITSLLLGNPVWNSRWYRDADPGRALIDSDCWFCRYHWLNWVSLMLVPLCLIVSLQKKLVCFEEWLLGLFLWAIPYFSHTYWNYGFSFARYSLFVFPVYAVGAWYISRLPQWAVWGFLGALLILLMFFSYGFGAGCAIF